MKSDKKWRAINTAEMIKPSFLRGPYGLIQPLVERWIGVSKVNDIQANSDKIMERDGTTGGDGFSLGCLETMQSEVTYNEDLLEALRSIDGAAILVVNHPYGCIDAMALMQCLQQARPEPGGWKIMANQVLRSIRALQDVALAVDPFAEGADRAANLAMMKKAIKYLKGGGMIGFFPAGRVSSMSDRLGAVCDLEWSDHALKLAKASGAHVVVAHIDGQNSDEFINMPVDNVSRRARQLVREFPKQVGKKMVMSYGGTISPAEVARLARKKGKVAQLHARCHAGSERRTIKPVKEEPESAIPNLYEQQGGEDLKAEIQGLREEAALWENDKHSLFLFKGEQAPLLLEQVGRGRAVTFAAIGAGAGNEIDLSPEDQYYHHLVLWDRDNHALIGSYRIGMVQEVIKERGVEGLYLDHVFKIDPKFYDHQGRSMELSRSFILPQHQKNPQMLDLLWRGLGLAVQKMKCETLFGSVTISASFSPLSQGILVDTLDRFYSEDPEMRKLVQARVPFQPSTKYHPLVSDAWKEDGLNRLNSYIEELEGNGQAIPPLIRYYVSLGAKFLSFHVEPSFNNAIYCLLSVSTSEMPRRYQKRFLGGA